MPTEEKSICLFIQSSLSLGKFLGLVLNVTNVLCRLAWNYEHMLNSLWPVIEPSAGDVVVSDT